MQDTIEGYVEHIIFRNEDNGYTVLNLMSEGSEVTCVKVILKDLKRGRTSGTAWHVCGTCHLWTAT